MKKLLVSDYDGTLCTNSLQLRLNIEAIKKFIEDGNHFVIATGRYFHSIKEEIAQYEIPYHYLITNNGLLTYDRNDTCLHSYNNCSMALEELKNILYKKGYNPKIYMCPLTGKIVQVEIETRNLNFSINVDTFMEKYFGIVQTEWILNDIKYTYFSEMVTKKNALQRLLEYLPYSYQSIITVGNDINDVEMLDAYDGYKIKNSSDSIDKYPFKTVESVHQLIKKVED